MLDINSFITYCLINQLFLSENMLNSLRKLHVEYQSVFDSFYLHHSTLHKEGIDQDTKAQFIKNFFDAGNKLKAGSIFQSLEETIVKEMRTDLRVDRI
jgi:hypothetical protein